MPKYHTIVVEVPDKPVYGAEGVQQRLTEVIESARLHALRDLTLMVSTHPKVVEYHFERIPDVDPDYTGPITPEEGDR